VETFDYAQALSAAPTVEYDCQQCGACCVDYFGGPEYVPLHPGEAQRMRRLGLPVIRAKWGDCLGTRPHDGPGGPAVCAAFSGKVGQRCACSIYPDRPVECRWFERGSLECRATRLEAGLPL
jgi:Fe-S-cluster containining protein